MDVKSTVLIVALTARTSTVVRGEHDVSVPRPAAHDHQVSSVDDFYLTDTTAGTR